MKSVGIIGAGPAGLVTAKTFLQNGGFSVTVFEAADRAGGMWRAEPSDDGDKCSPDMRTNLSKFTVAFSDFSWASVDLSDPDTGVTNSANPPIFPKAWHVGRYLRAYARKNGVEVCIKFGLRVTGVKASNDFSQWTVTCANVQTQELSVHVFDYIIIASGFFGKPITSRNSTTKHDHTFQHSSAFREACSFPPSKIAVIGGGISGSEAAAQAAFQLSSARYLPGDTNSAHAETKIYHVINRPFYCLPRYLPQNPHNPNVQDFNLAPKFLPNDLVLYNLSRRGEGKISAAISTVPQDKAKKGHDFIRSMIGGDQRELGRSELVYRPEHLQYPGYTGISDTYSEFVRSGLIVPVQGWVDDIKIHEQDGTFSLVVTPRKPWRRTATDEDTPGNTITGVTGVIEATGFETDLDFLDVRVKQLLEYDPLCPRVPILLSRGSIFVRAIPSLAFVGFYEGPYWTVMELQARLVVERWTTKSATTIKSETGDLYQCTDSENMRCAIKERSLQVPQFWMMDYVGLIEELSQATKTKRDDLEFNGQHGPAFAARYQKHGTNPESRSVVKDVINVIKASQEGEFVAAAVFRGMQGTWDLKRKIDSRSAASPGGIFSGSANFHPRTPTSRSFSSEYLYIEEGIFTMDTGFSFPASRRYIYRYNESTDTITAWFVDEDGASAGALFNTWNFYPPEDDYHGWMAKGHHWCDPDTYKNTCEFRFRGTTLQTFGITYQVEGPRKDYSHESWYERPKGDYK